MMQGKWVAFFALCWIIGVIFGSAYDGAAFWMGNTSGGYTTSPRDTISVISGGGDSEGGSSISTQKLPLIGSISFITPAVNFVKSIFCVVTLQFSFLQPYPMIQWFFSAFGSMGFFSLVMLIYGIIRGNITYG